MNSCMPGHVHEARLLIQGTCHLEGHVHRKGMECEQLASDIQFLQFPCRRSLQVLTFGDTANGPLASGLF